MKARSVVKTGNKSVRVAKQSSAKDAIGIIEKNRDIFLLTFGQFSVLDVLLVVLRQTGPADVVISSWTAADSHLERIKQLLDGGEITNFKIILDRSFKSRQPKYDYHMHNAFGSECIRYLRSHTKFILLRNEEFDIVIHTSANLNDNARLENLEICENKKFAEFMQSVVDDVFSEVRVGELRSSPVSLNSVQDEFPFIECAANPINGKDLNEPHFTHTLKKR